jgi:hypothetical protein
MQYGFFDIKNREYVITRHDTPTPWINYIGSGKYGGIVSNTGGGYSFHKDPKNRRVTRYRYNSLPVDRPGRYIYLKNKETGKYWNPGFEPSQTKLSKYRCRHGLGYTVILFMFGILTTGIPVIITSFGDPYIRQFCPAAPTYINAFDETVAAQEAASKAWFGEIAIKGKMPVSMSHVFDRGEGLTLNK